MLGVINSCVQHKLCTDTRCIFNFLSQLCHLGIDDSLLRLHDLLHLVCVLECLLAGIVMDLQLVSRLLHLTFGDVLIDVDVVEVLKPAEDERLLLVEHSVAKICT